jgi:hypothetical protein
LLVALVTAAALVLGRPTRRAALDAVPRDAWLVVTADATALRASPLARPLLAAGDKAGLVGASLKETCGFDPIERIAEVAIASPEGGERGDFGMSFTGSFAKDELVECASRVIQKRGGTPSTAARGAFTIVEDTGDAKHARLAYREGGPFLVGRGPWLDAMMDAADGAGERMRAEHVALRSDLQGGSGSARSRAVVLTALLPVALRDKLKADMSAEADDQGKGSSTFSAVLGVSALGIAFGPGADGSTEFTARLRCETTSGCEEVKSFVERKRAALAKDLGLRLIGLGPLIESLSVSAQGPVLSATARGSSDGLAQALERALSFGSNKP